jgi:hypothetical protein
VPANKRTYRSVGVSLRTPIVGVPNRDFPAVAAGTKREFRMPWVADATHSALQRVPTPVVAYSKTTRIGGAGRSCLLVCERFWREPLDAISPASIEAEGFTSIKEFRGYWRYRYKKGYDRFQQVWCFRVRPHTAEDEEHFKDVLYERLLHEPLRRISARQQS